MKNIYLKIGIALVIIIAGISAYFFSGFEKLWGQYNYNASLYENLDAKE